MRRGIASLFFLFGVAPLGAAGFSAGKAPAALAATAPSPEPLQLAVAALKSGAVQIPAWAPPALFDTSRAEALLSRIQPRSQPAAVRRIGVSAQEGALRTLQSANSLLRDFTPKEIAKMPLAQLKALTGILFDQLDGKPARPDVDGIATLAEARKRKILAASGAPLDEAVLSSAQGERSLDVVEVRGAPDGFKSATHHPRVLRHYTTKEGYAAIMASRSIGNGPTPYVQLSPEISRKYFPDLTGVFFTRPGIGGEKVGVPKSEFPFYVDVALPDDLPLFEVEAGRIFLLPLPGGARDWVKKYFNDWIRTGRTPSGYEGMIEKISHGGGPGPELQVPVRIVASGRVK